MEKITEKEARELLKKYSPDNSTFQKIYQHSKAVQKAAVAIAKAIQKQGHKVDMEFIRTASLLHDIGRFQAPPGSDSSIQHGMFGAKILRKEKLPKHALLCERHLGAGITKEEIVKHNLPLPKKDLIPRTIEEKIVTYADDLVFKDRLATVDEVLKRFKKEIKSPAAFKRMVELHNEIEELRGGSYIIK